MGDLDLEPGVDRQLGSSHRRAMNVMLTVVDQQLCLGM